MRVILALITGLLVTTQARAGFDVEVMGGARTGTVDTSSLPAGSPKPPTVPGTEVAAGFHLSPWRAPVAIGLGVSQTTYDFSKVDKFIDDQAGVTATVTDKTTSLDYGPEVVVWAPIPFFKPYLRVGYMMGTTTQKASFSGTVANTAVDESYTAKFSETGTDYGIGIRLSPAPFIGLVVEYNVANMKQKFTSMTDTTNGVVTNSTTDANGKDPTNKFDTTGIRIGLNVGI